MEVALSIVRIRQASLGVRCAPRRTAAHRDRAGKPSGKAP